MDLLALLHPLAAQPLPGAACVLLALLVALAVDARWGEPPARWHPVVWMGRAWAALGQRIAPAAATGRDWKCFWLAALAWSALAAMVLVAAALLQAAALGTCCRRRRWRAQALPGAALAALLLGLLLKPLLALAHAARARCARSRRRWPSRSTPGARGWPGWSAAMWRS